LSKGFDAHKRFIREVRYRRNPWNIREMALAGEYPENGRFIGLE